MYATRQQQTIVFGDENKRGEGKMLHKAGSRGAAAPPAHQRRALADVGNLVGALSSRCNVTGKEGQEALGASKAAGPVGARRTFGTTLNGNSHQANNASDKKAAKPPAPGALPVPDKWGSKGTRTAAGLAPRPAGAPLAPPNHNAPATSSGIGSVASNVPPAGGQAKAIMTRGAMRAALLRAQKEKELCMTAQLAANSQAACSTSDAEMAEPDDFADIDAMDHGNVLQVIDYIEDIYCFYRRAEAQSQVAPDYMVRQRDINERMRGILLDWLVEVHFKFKLEPETLYLTANLIDRFLAAAEVNRRDLQLVGVTAMLLASKYEEIWAPEVKDFVYISDNAYTKDQILRMEKLMLNTLKFNLTVPTPHHFALRFLKAATECVVDRPEAKARLAALVGFLVELSLPEYPMLQFTPSHLAAAAVHTGLRVLGRKPEWTPALQHHTGYTAQELRPCATMLVQLHQRASTSSLVAVYKKYSSDAFLQVAKLPCMSVPADDCASQS